MHELFEANAYHEYLETHGLSVQLTEALAEYWHQRVREELLLPSGSVAAEDPSDIEDFSKLGYRGANSASQWRGIRRKIAFGGNTRTTSALQAFVRHPIRLVHLARACGRIGGSGS